MLDLPPYILETQFAPPSHIFCMQPWKQLFRAWDNLVYQISPITHYHQIGPHYNFILLIRSIPYYIYHQIYPNYSEGQLEGGM